MTSSTGSQIAISCENTCIVLNIKNLFHKCAKVGYLLNELVANVVFGHQEWKFWFSWDENVWDCNIVQSHMSHGSCYGGCYKFYFRIQPLGVYVYFLVSTGE